MTNGQRLGAVPEELTPAIGEAAVLSVLAVRRDDRSLQLVSGSLLIVPSDVAGASWRRWTARQPLTHPQRVPTGFDLGPGFLAEPFPGIVAARRAIPPAEWSRVVTQFASGAVELSTELCEISTEKWSPLGLIYDDRESDTAAVVAGARRPVRGIVATLPGIQMPHSEPRWDLQLPPHEPRGPARGEMFRHRSLTHWSSELLGINWVASDDFPPPARFVLGRMQTSAWIAGLRPDFEEGAVNVMVGWDQNQIDPLGCSVALEIASDRVVLLSRQVRISELPVLSEKQETITSGEGQQPHQVDWHERLLTVSLPRGPRRTAFGISLVAADGTLLDKRPTAHRVEQIQMTIRVMGSTEPGHTTVSGDQSDPPTVPEIDDAVIAEAAMTSQSREAAAERRLSTIGQLQEYLQWRFSCHAGELLVVDPYLLDEPLGPTIALLESLARPVRVLAKMKDPSIYAGLPMRISAKALAHGRKTVHDRIWIVGQTGLLVGGSPNTFLLPNPPATTITELPVADVAIWREHFEAWWA
jgi:hypothetical protein